MYSSEKGDTILFSAAYTEKGRSPSEDGHSTCCPSELLSAHSLTWLDKDLGSRGTEEHGLTFSRHLQCCSLIPMNNTCSVLQKMGFILTLRSLLPRVATTLNQEII